MRPIALTSSHIEEFWALRRALLSELGELPGGGEAQTFEEASRVYFLSHIGRDLFCWGIPAEDGLAACGSLCLFERLPYPGNPAGREGYLLNVYTRPEFRGKGYATRILEEMIRFAGKNGIGRLWLSASDMGRPLYRRAGFADRENEMELFLPAVQTD